MLQNLGSSAGASLLWPAASTWCRCGSGRPPGAPPPRRPPARGLTRASDWRRAAASRRRSGTGCVGPRSWMRTAATQPPASGRPWPTWGRPCQPPRTPERRLRRGPPASAEIARRHHPRKLRRCPCQTQRRTAPRHRRRLPRPLAKVGTRPHPPAWCWRRRSPSSSSASWVRLAGAAVAPPSQHRRASAKVPSVAPGNACLARRQPARRKKEDHRGREPQAPGRGPGRRT
mmetsp:Transcript_7573/g.24064  ORF Transcript_7573/g.24064 Transcript_7573/m.24064 type:complete len:230 (+) Transcript_7573:60-749(+)